MRTLIRYSKRPKVEEFARKPIWAEQSWTYYESVDKFPKMQSNNPSLGFVYVVKYGDMIKIGFTANPQERFCMKYKPALLYGVEAESCYVSPAHKNYVDTEHILHESFSEYRVQGTELFRIKFSEKIPTMMCMALEQVFHGESAL